ncbi:hypothetical protein [Gemmatimonas aurantiaca]|uniref:hypothetical protein n=1 Tax=Gemmatimonas aurantiaca TaxID=173480 RepID=UPI00301C8424
MRPFPFMDGCDIPIRLTPFVLAVALLGGCSGGDGSVTVKGDVAGLDSLAHRGDSLIAMADRGPRVSLDSLRAAMDAELRRSGVSVATGSGDGVLVGGSLAPSAAAEAPAAAPMSSTGAEMSRRAQARGDSIARAVAARLVGAGDANRSRSDSLRGVLAYQGKEPARQVVLQTPEATVTLSGMATSGMSRLVGKEVVIHGLKVTPRDIVVSDYVVRAADGVPAVDGVLDAEGVLRLTDGSGVRRVPVPQALRPFAGARVWIALRDGVPVNYGVIGRR